MSELLKFSLALENRQLRRRVQAAVINVAQAQNGAPGARGWMATTVLADLQRHWEDFTLGVAADTEVQGLLAVSDDNSYVVASNVEDDKISAIVNGLWRGVAEKYAPQPDSDGE